MWLRRLDKAMLGVLVWVACIFSHAGADLGQSTELLGNHDPWATEPRVLKDPTKKKDDDIDCSNTFCCFQGNLLPLFGDTERKVPNIIRLIMYMTGLLYSFLGIGIISDVFMTGIEKVTSRKYKVPIKGQPGKYRTVLLWNATVSNLTLMALGSSAPEILLSLIEVSFDNMFLGDLGAGTIVGSAAFNLLCISAVCVLAMEDGDVRRIDQTKVYIVTAFFSVFAYLWLMFILMVTTPDVCTVGEAAVTLLFTPLFVFLAYLADRGYFDFKPAIDKLTYQQQKDADPKQSCLAEDVSDEELKEIEQKIRENHGTNLTDDQVAEIMRLQYLPKRSRAYYRHLAVQAKISGKKAVDAQAIESSRGGTSITETAIAFDDIDQEKQNLRIYIEFAVEQYVFAKIVGMPRLWSYAKDAKTLKCLLHTLVERVQRKPVRIMNILRATSYLNGMK